MNRKQSEFTINRIIITKPTHQTSFKKYSLVIHIDNCLKYFYKKNERKKKRKQNASKELCHQIKRKNADNQFSYYY